MSTSEEFQKRIEEMQELKNRLDRIENRKESAGISNIPDPVKHLKLSLAKSVIRIAGASTLLVFGNIWLTIAGVMLVIAELIGIAEELV